MQTAAPADAGEMDATDVHFALREIGVTPVLDKDHNRLLIDPDVELSSRLAEAFAAKHDRLLKQALLGEVLRFVHERIRKREGRPHGDYTTSTAAAATFARMAEDSERISDAFESQDVDAFKDTLRSWSRAAVAAYEGARKQDESSVHESPGPVSGTRGEPRTQPARPATDSSPLQRTLL